MKKSTVMSFLVCLFLFGQASGSESKPWLTLERTGCLGICPIFTVRVFRDGRVEFLGTKFVVAVGPQRGKVLQPSLNRLRQRVANANLAKLPADCCSSFDVSDQPWTNLEVADGSGVTRVRHYHGSTSAPPWLTDLEDEIVSVTGAQKWIGSEAEQARMKERWFKQNEADRYPRF